MQCRRIAALRRCAVVVVCMCVHVRDARGCVSNLHLGSDIVMLGYACVSLAALTRGLRLLLAVSIISVRTHVIAVVA